MTDEPASIAGRVKLSPQQIADPSRYRPGDTVVQIWPSDRWTNISADARVLAKRSAAVFRAHLTKEPQQ